MKIIVFDFDGSLIYTAEPDEGRKIWLEKTGKEFPHPIGWWGKPESLDISIFYPTINEWIFERYKRAIALENVYVILVTGRPEKLRKEVLDILDFHGIKFHDVFCNTGGDTFKFKTKLLENILIEKKATEMIIYDDRQEHLAGFTKWAEYLLEKDNVVINVVDVVNKIQLN